MVKSRSVKRNAKNMRSLLSESLALVKFDKQDVVLLLLKQNLNLNESCRLFIFAEFNVNIESLVQGKA